MEGTEGGGCCYFYGSSALYFFFLISIGHNFWCPWVTIGHFSQSDDCKTFLFSRIGSAGPGMGPEVHALPAHSGGKNT